MHSSAAADARHSPSASPLLNHRMDSRSAKTVRRVIVRQREFATFGQSFLVLALHEAMHRSHVTDALRASGRTALAANAAD